MKGARSDSESMLRITRMQQAEINAIIDTGLSNTPMQISKRAREAVIRASKGYLYYAQCLSRHAAMIAVADHRREIQFNDVRLAASKIQ